MKTSFDTLLNHRAEAISSTHCPYTPDQIDGLVVRAIASVPASDPSPSVGPLLSRPSYSGRFRLYSLAASLMLVCFIATYLFAPSALYPPMRTVAQGGCAETYDHITIVVDYLSNTVAI